MPLRLESPRGIDRFHSVSSSFTLPGSLSGLLARFEKAQVGNGHYFSNGKAIMNLGYLYILRTNTSHFIGLLCC